MKTDQLIDMLSINSEQVKSGSHGAVLLLAVIAGVSAAIVLMLVTVGPRHDLLSAPHLEWIGVKLLFAIGVIMTGLPLLNKSMRPGSDEETYWKLIALPFLGTIAVASAVLVLSHPQVREAMLRGATTISPLRCLFSIVFFAAVPLILVICAVRRGAPTRLKLSGGIAGIVAGGVGAAAYAFNCTSDTIPFIAIWYGAAIILCGVIGAQLSPRTLRW
ncbi:MAG TPA: DUF1109 domain-containing protein [Candidatus Binataceae bacterium]|nr:DUF1109 domain-containing protein [Candidatus Binataceae bacterium]